jgi:hypothetical protein
MILVTGHSYMNQVRLPKVAVLEKDIIIEEGYLNKDMPQNDDSYLYEIYGDSGRVYIVSENDFIYIRE